MDEQKRISKTAPEMSKRGRPRIMSGGFEALVAYSAPDVKTQRHKLNVYYALQAMSTLGDDPRLSWIFDSKRMKAGDKKSWKPSILSELGRIEDRETMLAVALAICEAKPKTKDAISRIRHARIGRTVPGCMEDVYAAVERAVNDYMCAHRDTSWRVVEGALEQFLEGVRNCD
jgi:hypothetical protein